MADYKELLDKLYKKVKPIVASERFEIPKVKGHVEGNRTIITNFLQIADVLRRPKEHIAKYLSKELAALGIIENERLVLNRKLSSGQLNDKLQAYTDEFVICKECKKPDTELIKQNRLTLLHCLACGAKYPTTTKI